MNHETRLQCAFVDWVRKARPIAAALMTAFPAGEYRRPETARLLKRQGLVPGWPDLMVMLPRGGFHGLFIELKAPEGNGRVSANQMAIIEALRDVGYAVAVCHSYDEACASLDNYLSGELGREPREILLPFFTATRSERREYRKRQQETQTVD